MVLPPSLNTTFVVAVIIPLVLGLLVGIVIKSLLKVGIAIAIIILILIAVGALSPDQVIKPLEGLFSSASPSSLESKAKEIAGYLPYSSLAFLIGLAIGFFKG
ncbi:MAG TPA: hypothetical protein VEJ36_01545 [Nitrososphaerales archaeon]|nr:hypothetical protein [Nitrososphaerales archaeon]